MNTRYYMVIIKGEIKTSEIMSCGYNRNTQKWDVKFNNGKTYSYAYLNVEKLTDPEVLNPNMYRISREGREFFDVNAIYVFRSGSESYGSGQVVIWKVDGYIKENEHQSIEWKESWQDEY